MPTSQRTPKKIEPNNLETQKIKINYLEKRKYLKAYKNKQLTYLGLRIW